MTPEQLNRYRAQMQQRGTQAPLDPRRQQALSQRQRESLASQPGRAPATSPPKRNDRSLFEPPAARQNQSPGQPRPIVIGGAPGMSRSAQPTASRGPYSNSYNANRPNVQYGNAVSRGPMQSRAR